uniref:UBC core domain-containing protein n=1 Tax=Strigamia maritima TaxID=126957 RepID=T1ISW3_STRMM
MDSLYQFISRFLNVGENGDNPIQLRRQGSVRKVLPLIPDADSSLCVSAKIIDRQINISKYNYASYFLEYSLMAEYDMLCKQKLPGVYVLPAANTPLKWYGVLFASHNYYEDGVFRFILHIPDNYPNGMVPRLFFQPPIFHPLVDAETGELDLLREFSKWRRNVNYLWQILAFMRRIFIKMDCTNPINSQASFLFENDIEMFKFKLSESIRRCKDFLFDSTTIEDPHEIRFYSLDNPQFQDLRRNMLSFKHNEENNVVATGFSWVDPNSLETFSECS